MICPGLARAQFGYDDQAGRIGMKRLFDDLIGHMRP